MSEQYFLEKCIVAAEDAKGSYAMMAHLSQDSIAKQMYKNMLIDASNQLNQLNDRMKYLQKVNQPYDANKA